MADTGEYFEQSGLWGKAPEEYQVRVREDLLRLIGTGRVTSILDVGCGDGVIANALAAEVRVVGVDTSEAALRHVKRETVKASATKLPFGDGSFDLVMANDLLEHLTDEEMQAATSEMRRVARRWVVVTVPFMESVESGMTRCGNCGAEFHVNQHQRGFGVTELIGLMVGLKPGLMVFSGAKVNVLEAVQRRLRGHFGVRNSWEMAVCPKCGARASVGSARELVAAVDAVAERVLPWVKDEVVDRSECIAVYSVDGTGLVELPRGAEGVSVVKELGGVYSRAVGAGIDFLVGMSDEKAMRPGWFSGGQLVGMSARNGGAWVKGALELLVCLPEPREVAAVGAEKELLLAQAGQMEQLKIDLQNVRAENEALHVAAGRHEQVAVELQNVGAENVLLRTAAGKLERVLVELQNVKAENDVLKVEKGRREQVEVDLQNARAENDALKLAKGRGERAEVDVQNMRAELDGLKMRAGQTEQLTIDLQNVRAENDALKTRAKRCDEAEVELQNLRANGANAAAKRTP